jgi:TatD DNase family protein
MLIDSHCHLDRLDLAVYGGDFSALMRATREAGVGHLLCVCIELEQYPSMLGLVEGQADVSISVGVHPNERTRRTPDPAELVELARHPKNVAIGETGLDYFHGEGDLQWQRDRFRCHIEAAKACRKPLIIHTRDARDDTLRLMREAGAASVGGVMHCFTESWEMASEALDMGFYISFSGILTFRNADALREVAKKVPLDRLLIETDAPYLTPVPYRGKPNRPAYVALVAERLAGLRGVAPEEIARLTSENFFRLFPSAAQGATQHLHL